MSGGGTARPRWPAATGPLNTRSLNTASVSTDCPLFQTFYDMITILLGINCTQSDLEAIINGNNDVEIVGLDSNRMWYETSYK